MNGVFVHGKRFSILPLLTINGIEEMHVVEGSVNEEIFMWILEFQVVHIWPAHCSCHHEFSLQDVHSAELAV